MSEKSASAVEKPDFATLAYLRQCFIYDAATGVLTWLQRPQSHFATVAGWKHTNTRYVGKEAGNLNNFGYKRVKVGGKFYLVHRIAFALHHDIEIELVPENLDHINCYKTDNRICNLRPATTAENSRNRGRNTNNTSGHKGVSWHKRDHNWSARIRVNGELKFLGCFDTAEAAGAAYAAAAAEHFGEFARAA